MSVEIQTLVEKYDTPLYVYDFNNITNRYDELKDAFGGKKSLWLMQ